MTNYEYWLQRCSSCLDFEYDDPTLGRCIHFIYCKQVEDNDNKSEATND